MSFMPDWGYDWNRRITYRLSGLFSWYCQTLSRNRLECNFRGTIGTRRLREKKQERETVGETVITKVSAKSHLMSFPLTFLVSSEACDHAVCLISSVVRKRIRDKHNLLTLSDVFRGWHQLKWQEMREKATQMIQQKEAKGNLTRHEKMWAVSLLDHLSWKTLFSLKRKRSDTLIIVDGGNDHSLYRRVKQKLDKGRRYPLLFLLLDQNEEILVLSPFRSYLLISLLLKSQENLTCDTFWCSRWWAWEDD